MECFDSLIFFLNKKLSKTKKMIIIRIMLGRIFKTQRRFPPFLSLREARRGFSLVEMLIVISLLSILFGIAFVGYSAYIKNVTLKNMRKIAEAFPNVVNTCVTSSGWKVTLPDGTTTVNPCDDLTKLDFVCPISADGCPNSGWTNKCCDLWVDPGNHSYICLDVRVEMSGKKYQLHVVVNRGDTNDYKISCAEEVPNYTDLNTTADCNPSNAALTDCEW